MKKGTSQILRAFNDACNDLAEAVNAQLFQEVEDGKVVYAGREHYWIGDEVGGLCDYGDTDILDVTELALILKYGVTFDEYAEWRDANLDHPDLPKINLASWLRGFRYEMLENKQP